MGAMTVVKSGSDQPHGSRSELRTEDGVSRRDFLLRGAGGAAGLTLLPALLSACGSSSSSGGSSGGGTLNDVTWAQSSGPPDMNPLRRFDVEGAMVLALGLETLVKYDRDFKIVPSLASDFSHSSDLSEWTYRLRDGISFWDGKPLTIDDVVYSYEQHLTNPQSAFGFFYGIVKDVRAKGKTDLVVRLKTPSILFGYTPAHTAGLIWQKSSGERMGSKLGTPGNLPVGTGPFKLLTYVENDRVTLERNEGYDGPKASVKNMTVRTIPDDPSRLLAMQSGELSGTFDVPPEQFDQWQSSGGNLTKAPGLGVIYMSFNVKRPPFDDIHVRRAFSYAVDRQGLVQSAIQGAGEVATAFIPPRFWAPLNLSADEVKSRYASFPQYDFDLDKARAELQASKYASGISIAVRYPNDLQRLGKMLLNVKENLAPMGVKMSVSETTEDAYFADLYEHRATLPLQVVLYRPDYPDPANYASFFATEQIAGGNNFGNYSNPEVDQLLHQQSVAARPEDRIDPLMKVAQIVNEQAVVATAWWEASLLATKSSITAYADPVWYLVPWATTIRPA
jgi:peptide/nickel transport system substrate-binding protein